MKRVGTISISELTKMAGGMYGNLVKAVVDVKQNRLVVDAELHSDEEQELLDSGSQQSELWGINLYPEKYGTEEFIEFDSMINIRPQQNNRSRNVEDQKIRQKIIAIVHEKVKR